MNHPPASGLPGFPAWFSRFPLGAFLILPFWLEAQSAAPSCADLKVGIFHSYPKNSIDHYITERDGNLQKEINLSNGDTVLYEVKWSGDCSYSLSYRSGGRQLSAGIRAILQKHKLVCQVTKVTQEYYLYTVYLDKRSNLPIQTDTMWFQEKVHFAGNLLYRRIANTNVLRRMHFSDTSRYAVLYVYRPGKLGLSLSNYLMYMDDNPLCVAKNNSGYIFLILQEGRHILKSRVNKDEISLPVDFKFGQRYYLKSMIHGGFHNFKNYKLDLVLVNADTGEKEFMDVNLQ